MSNAQNPNNLFDLSKGTWGLDPLTGGRMAYFRDVPLVAKLRLIANQARYVFFQQGYGDTVGAGATSYVLTNADTNMKDARVPASELWYLFAMRMAFEPFTIPDDDVQQVKGAALEAAIMWAFILNNSWVKMEVEQQEWFRIPGSRFFSGAKTPLASYTGSLIEAAQVNNPAFDGVVEWLDRVNAFNGKFGGYAPFVLEKNTSFSVTVEFESAAMATLNELITFGGTNAPPPKFGPEFARNVVGLVAV